MSDANDYTNRCACGWEISGSMDTVVEATIDHGRRIHNMAATREQVVAALIAPATEDAASEAPA